jgi:hypothetical protein
MAGNKKKQQVCLFAIGCYLAEMEGEKIDSLQTC